MKKVILVDGNNLLFRSFYATLYSGNLMKTSSGIFTNAVYGFANMINKIINEEKPKYMLVAFDKGKTFRHDQYEEYKAGRMEMPDELRGQFDIAKDLLTAMGIKYFEIDNYEADDIIGSVAKIVDEEDKFIATIVSSDKDLLQLISDEVEVKLLKQKDFIRYQRDNFIADYGFEPIHMIDLKALQGDSSDNIKGVKGVGEKTALKLIREYQTIENLYKNLNQITGALYNKLKDGQQDAIISKELCTIAREIELPFTLESLKYEGPDVNQLNNLYQQLEFTSLMIKQNNQEQLVNYQTIDDINEIDFSEEYSLYFEFNDKNYHLAKVIGVGYASSTQNFFMTYDFFMEHMDKFQGNIITYHAKAIYAQDKRLTNLKIVDDIMLMAYINNYVIKDDISALALAMGVQIDAYHKKDADSDIIQNVCLKAKFVFEIRDKLKARLVKDDLLNIYYDIELPLTKILYEMEQSGVVVDAVVLDEIGKDLEVRLTELAKEIYLLAGMEFNIASPKQLGPVLFEHLGIMGGKKTKTGYSTDRDALYKIKGQHQIIEKILEYRTLSKVNGTYAQGLKPYIMSDGKIHPIFSQTIARTGRLSCMEPNLQNIPIRNEEGRIIRKAFLASPNHLLISFDYSQIELRIFAHLSDVESLKTAFIKGMDIHTKTAMDIYKVSIEEVTNNMRRVAKAVNFGIIYGISGFGLSNNLDIDVKEAKKFIDVYLNTFPGAKAYMDEMINLAKSKGYVKTLYGRIRTIEELQSNNYMVRQMGERMALNTPIQGTSADIVKVAMIQINQALKKQQLKSKMIIQVHDELIFDVLMEEKETIITLVKDIMESVIKLSVPLEVSVDQGLNWYALK